MGPDLYPFEAALCGLVQPSPIVPASLSREGWDAVLQLALREGMAPLVHAAVTGIAAGRVPEPVLASAAWAYGRAAAEVAGACAQLSQILSAFQAAGVTPMLLKGAALARFVYADPALRPFGDVDVLVPFEQIDRAHTTLVQAGYAIHGGAPAPADRRWRHARGYYDPEGRRLPVDLHWRYAGYPLLVGIDYAAVFARARTAEVDGGPARVPSPEDLLLALSVHFQRDLWYRKPRLRYLRDVTEVVRRYQVDWERTVRSVQDAPLLRTPVYLTLAAASALLGAAIPRPAAEALRPPGRGWASDRLLARVCRNALRPESPAAAMAQVAWMRWLDSESVAGYLRWMGGLVFAPRALAPGRRRWWRGG